MPPRPNWRNKFLDAQSDLMQCVRALRPVVEDCKARGNGPYDETWNPDHHVEVTLRVSEVRRIQELLKRLDPQKERS